MSLLRNVLDDITADVEAGHFSPDEAMEQVVGLYRLVLALKGKGSIQVRLIEAYIEQMPVGAGR